MDEIVNDRIGEVLSQKLDELGRLELTDPNFNDAMSSVKKLVDAQVEVERLSLEYVQKDDVRVIEKEKLAIEKERLEIEQMRFLNEQIAEKFKRHQEELAQRHQRRVNWVQTGLRGLGYLGTGAAFVLTLGFERDNVVSSSAGRKVIGNIIGNIGKD